MSGAARHWWFMRLSSALLLPLSLWLVWAAVRLAGTEHAAAAAFMASPLNALAAVLLAGIGLYHTAAGTREVIEDYVPGEGMAGLLVLALRVACAAGFLAVVYTVYRLASGG